MKFKIYNHNNVSNEVELQDFFNYDDILSLDVIVVSGDEVVCLYLVYGYSLYVDSDENRILDFYDGTYTLTDTEQIKKWIEWEPNKDSGTYSYQRLDEFDY